MEESGEELPGALEPDQDDLARLLAAAKEIESGWRSDETIELGAVTWTPHLVRDEPRALVHVHLADRLRPYLLERMRAATDAGFAVHVILPLASLYDEALLGDLAELEARVMVIKEDGSLAPSKPALLSIAANHVTVSTPARLRLGTVGWSLSLAAGTASQRGDRLEGLLGFLLSQTGDFAVVATKYRTETEELDVVVQQKATQGRVWALGAPLILVEAKNWDRKVPQKEVSAFRVKIEGKRRTVRIGLMFARSGFTGDAADQELRFSSDDITIALIGRERIEAWIAADDCDSFLEDTIREAMLR